MCGQDFRIHHWFAEELAWVPCITCQNCQALLSTALHYSAGNCACLSPLCTSLLPSQKQWLGEKQGRWEEDKKKKKKSPLPRPSMSALVTGG